MKNNKNTLAITGDKITFKTNVEVKEGYNFQKGNLYNGHIISHSDANTLIEFIGDNGEPVKTTISYDVYSNGMSEFCLQISDEELNKRSEKWKKSKISDAKEHYDKTVDGILKIKFE